MTGDCAELETIRSLAFVIGVVFMLAGVASFVLIVATARRRRRRRGTPTNLW